VYDRAEANSSERKCVEDDLEKLARSNEVTLVVRQPDGRKCKICPFLDSDWDPVFLAIGNRVYITWGGLNKETGTSKGCYCYFCLRVWQKMYRHKCSMSKLVEDMGADAELHKSFRAYTKMLLDYCVANGVHDLNAPWAEFQKTLLHEEENTLEIMEDRSLIPVAEYRLEHGSPRRKGKEIISWRGAEFVQSDQVKYNARSSQSMRTKIITKLDDSRTLQLDANQMQNLGSVRAYVFT
jgi:hypothetical protein